MYAILSQSTAPRRPFRVTTAERARSFASFDAAARFARSVFSADRWPESPRPMGPTTGNPLDRPTRPAAAGRPLPSVESVEQPRAVFRVSGFRGMVKIQRDVTARGSAAAVRVFCDRTGVDRVTAIRPLTRRDPDTKAARQRRNIADRSSKARRQLSATEGRLCGRADRSKRS
jgi:hypothetical protein